MSFVNPSFLWAMFAVLGPIIIHLINFRRHKTLYFSNTSFLNDLKKETQTRTKLKQILILLARILTIVMLVIAFAGPFIPYNNADNQKKSEINAIYIDNSFSMEAESQKGQAFEQARQIAKQIVYNSNTGMDYIILTNDMLPEHQFIIDRDRFIREVDKMDISSSSITLDEIILKLGSLIPEQKKANLYIISDMQKTFISEPQFEYPKNINIIYLLVESVKSNNMFIDSCWFETPVHRLGHEENLAVKVVNLSDEDYVDIPVQLFINDSLKALASLSIEAGQSENMQLTYINTEPGYINARIELSDYPVTYDNSLYFNYTVDIKTSVLIINGTETYNNYLSSLYKSNIEDFVLHEVNQGSVQVAEFSKYDIILLNNISKISSGLISDLKEFVSAGGSLAFIPAAEIDYSSINNFLSAFNAGEYTKVKTNTNSIANLDYENRIFKNVFIDKSTQTGFPVISLAHKLVAYNNSTFSSIVNFENSNPLLIEGEYNKGRLYVFSATISDINSDFVKSPLFVPIFYNIAINSQLSNSIYAVLQNGAYLEINYPGEIVSSDIFRITDNENTDIVIKYNSIGKNLVVFIPKEIKKAGNFKLFCVDKFVSNISVNYNRSESVLDYYNAESLANFIESKTGTPAKIIDYNSDDISVELKEFEEGKSMWQLFLMLALAFILCEIAFARFLK